MAAGFASADSSSPAAFAALLGRDGEVAILRDALGDACQGRPRIVLLGGEAGIGKTRLAEEAARQARARGALVLWGSCWENEGAPAFWPWRRALGSLVAALSESELQSGLGRDPSTLATLATAFPDIAARLGRAEHGTAPVSSPEARFAFFDAVSAFLGRASALRPLVIVLDDLHWADPDSLLLLRFLARDAESSRLLVVATYRDVDVERRPQQYRVLAALARERICRRVDLAGLSREAVADLLDAELGHAATDVAVDQICEASAGNPFFVRELARLLTEGGRRDPAALLPASVRDVVAQRLDFLPPRCRETLRLAALAGRDFDVAVLDRIVPGLRERFADEIEPAVQARLVVARPGGSFGFVHALVGEALRMEIPARLRASLHGRIGVVLESLYGQDESRLAGLAHHFLAAFAGETEFQARAIDYSLRAAERATALAAYSEAVSHLDRALQALPSPAGPGADEDERRRCDVLLSLGEARRLAGEPEAAQTFALAADIAARLRSAPLRARAALGYASAVGPPSGQADPVVVGMLEQACADLQQADGRGQAESLLLGRLLARLAIELYWSPDRARRISLSRAALELVRPIDNPIELGRTLWDHHWAIAGPDTIDERMRIADEIIALPMPSPLLETRMLGYVCRITDRLELGDIDGVDADIAAFTREIATLRQHRHHWWIPLYRGLRRMLDGRLDEAESSVVAAMAEGERLRSLEAPLHCGAQLTLIRDLQGRLDEVRPWAWGMSQRAPEAALWHAVLALIHSGCGRLAEARAELDAVLGCDLAGAPRDGQWLVTVVHAVRSCGELGVAEAAPGLYEMLRPYAGRMVVIGTASGCLGSTSRFLGLLAGLMGNIDLVELHFDEALTSNTRLRAWPLVALTQADHAAALLGCAEGGYRERAMRLLEQAEASALRLGLQGLVSRIQALRRVAGSESASSVPPAPPASAEAAVNLFRRDGDLWTLAFLGRVARLRGARGLEHLAVLLARPGEPVHVLELAGTGGDLGDAGEVLDRRAAGEYRVRLSDLRAERDEAEGFADLGRVERLDAEIEQLAGQLAAGLGLGGRQRRAASASERARLAASKAIKASIEKIDEAHAALGAHLRATIRTGTMCVYAPDPNHPIAWETGAG